MFGFRIKLFSIILNQIYNFVPAMKSTTSSPPGKMWKIWINMWSINYEKKDTASGLTKPPLQFFFPNPMKPYLLINRCPRTDTQTTITGKSTTFFVLFI